jgi:hypothetical protein
MFVVVVNIDNQNIVEVEFDTNAEIHVIPFKKIWWLKEYSIMITISHKNTFPNQNIFIFIVSHS